MIYVVLPQRTTSSQLICFLVGNLVFHQHHHSRNLQHLKASARGGAAALELPEVCPADLPQPFQVYLAEAVGLGRRTALRALLSPLALWEHRAPTCINTKATFLRVRLLRLRSTPVLLQGGEVGQQAFMVELLQLQEVDGPLVWGGGR